MRLASAATLAALLLLCVVCISAYGDDDGGGDSGSDSGYTDDTGTTEPTSPDEGCEDTPDHPTRAAREARGFVVACVSSDETSVHVRNVSSHVLKVNSTAGVDEIVPGGVQRDAGVQAALSMTGIGWTSSQTHFVLPLGGSLVASGPGPAVVTIEPDLILTAQANSARYVGDWISSFLQVRGRAVASKVQSCARTAAEFAQTNAYVEDVLRAALDTGQCIRALSNALREGGESSVALPRARSAILSIARPVAEDQLVSFVARVLAR